MKPIAAAVLSMALLTGCSKQKTPPPVAQDVERSGVVSGYISVDRVQTRNPVYIAERHRLEVETPAAELEKSVQAVAESCRKLDCEVLRSSISGSSGEVSLRVMPRDLKALFDSVGRAGRVVLHTTTSENKTGEVIDVEARLKNLTGFRDNLRLMQAKSSATVRDLVDIQRELANVQSELDSLATRRKVLANETGKVAVDISFRPRGSTGMLASLTAAWDELGPSFFDSLATLITVAAAALPWLVLIVPAAWVLIRTAARRRARRAAPGAAAPATPQP